MLIPQNYYIFISAFIIVIYIAMFFIGYSRGFLYELVNLVYTALALFLAWFASPVLAKQFPLIRLDELVDDANLLNQLFDLDNIVNVVAYFLIIFLLMKLLYIFISLLVKAFNKIPVIGKVNKFLGGLAGLFNATLITLALSMLLSLPLFKNGKDVIDHTLFRYIRDFSDDVLTFVAEKVADSQIDTDLDGIDIDDYREQFAQWLKSLD